MMLPLDPRFRMIVGRMREVTSTDAKAATRRHAEVIAVGCGRTFAEALAEVEEAEALARTPRVVPAPVERPAPVKAEPIAPEPRRPDLTERVAAVLRADPAQSDRSVARAAECSPTHVGKVRRLLGLAVEERSVVRGGQRYLIKTRSDA